MRQLQQEVCIWISQKSSQAVPQLQSEWMARIQYPKESHQVGNQGSPRCPQGKGPGLAGTLLVLCSQTVERQ
jgi:hypothetical protein